MGALLLTASLAARGMALPECVTLLAPASRTCGRCAPACTAAEGCRRRRNVFAARFDGASIPQQHTARGDVR
jgi:hypothetical protein